MVPRGKNYTTLVEAAGAASVDRLASKGIPAIACQSLILSEKLAAYIGFDPYKAGRRQARGILSIKKTGRFILFDVNPKDPSTQCIRAGQLEMLQPFIEKGDSNIGAD